MFKTSDWKLIGVSIAVGAIITIIYDALKPCFSVLFHSNFQSFTCDSDVIPRIFTGFIAAVAGLAYLKVFKFMYKKETKNDSNPET